MYTLWYREGRHSRSCTGATRARATPTSSTTGMNGLLISRGTRETPSRRVHHPLGFGPIQNGGAAKFQHTCGRTRPTTDG